jgi:hypothetical protein
MGNSNAMAILGNGVCIRHTEKKMQNLGLVGSSCGKKAKYHYPNRLDEAVLLAFNDDDLA